MSDTWQSLTDTKPQACKVRLARIFKRPDQTMMDIMGELKTLTEEDLADFKRWFGEAGYPCT